MLQCVLICWTGVTEAALKDPGAYWAGTTPARPPWWVRRSGDLGCAWLSPPLSYWWNYSSGEKTIDRREKNPRTVPEVVPEYGGGGRRRLSNVVWTGQMWQVGSIRTVWMAATGAHGGAGLGVVRRTQLHAAVQIQLRRLRCEAKHLEAVADGGPIVAVLPGVDREEGNRVVVSAPGRKRKMSASKCGGGWGGGVALKQPSRSDPFWSRTWWPLSVALGSGVCVAQHLLSRSRKKSAGSATFTSTYTCHQLDHLV